MFEHYNQELNQDACPSTAIYPDEWQPYYSNYDALKLLDKL